jgi:hypothetical protein
LTEEKSNAVTTTLSTETSAKDTKIEKRESNHSDKKVRKGLGTSPSSEKLDNVTTTSAKAEQDSGVEASRRDKSMVQHVEKCLESVDSNLKAASEKPLTVSSHASKSVVKESRHSFKSVNERADNRISQVREGEKVEVVMRPLAKGTTNLWKPQELTEMKSDAFGLLGTVAVSKWDDESDNEKGYSEQIKIGETARTNFLKELEQKEKVRKRKMHRSSWDSALDLGKVNLNYFESAKLGIVVLIIFFSQLLTIVEQKSEVEAKNIVE